MTTVWNSSKERSRSQIRNLREERSTKSIRSTRNIRRGRRRRKRKLAEAAAAASEPAPAAEPEVKAAESETKTAPEEKVVEGVIGKPPPLKKQKARDLTIPITSANEMACWVQERGREVARRTKAMEEEFKRISDARKEAEELMVTFLTRGEVLLPLSKF